MSSTPGKIIHDMQTDRKELPFNFGAGPAMLPREVMAQAQEEFINWHGEGLSVMEMSHRSEAFTTIAEQAEADLRELLQVPDNYHVLFLQGGATSQFSMLPLNLLRGKKSADYFITGLWSEKAYREGRRFCRADVALTTKAVNYTSIPPSDTWQLNPEAAYVYYTDNETIQGVEFNAPPETGDVPLVTDMTSNILSRPVDVSQFGVIFAGAQKNLGPPGLVVVIIRDDLVGHAPPQCPVLYDYATQVKNHSMYNTPATFSWYITGLVLRWVREQGGVEEMHRQAQRKSSKLYDFIDDHDFYHNPVDRNCRSRMNVPFILADDKLDALFVSEAEENGLLALAGHRSVGGMRASIYNAMPEEGVDQLTGFMSDFARRHG